LFHDAQRQGDPTRSGEQARFAGIPASGHGALPLLAAAPRFGRPVGKSVAMTAPRRLGKVVRPFGGRTEPRALGYRPLIDRSVGALANHVEWRRVSSSYTRRFNPRSRMPTK